MNNYHFKKGLNYDFKSVGSKYFSTNVRFDRQEIRLTIVV